MGMTDIDGSFREKNMRDNFNTLHKDNGHEHVTYMLRRGFYPWKFAESLRETILYCRKRRMDEVMWMFVHGFGHLPLATQKRHVALLERARDATARFGIKYSINYSFTLGHSDYGCDIRKAIPDYEPIVGHDGQKSRECPCPLSPGWRRWMQASARIVCRTKPVRFWMEDDYRLTNHGPVAFGCYCPRHIREFAKRIGEPRLTREKLLRAILAPGKPHPWRKPWLDFCGFVLEESARLVQEAVYEVSPETNVALMVSTPWMHESEGRDYVGLLKAFAGPHPPTPRICNQGYQEGTPRAFFIQDEALKRVMPDLPENTCKCSEIESMPWYLYSKSANWLRAQIAMATIYGIPNHTLAIYDYVAGAPLEEEPQIGDMLENNKNYFEGLWQGFGRANNFRGIGILRHWNSARVAHTTKGASPAEWQARDSGWAHALPAFGFPIACRADEPVTAVTGQALRAFENKLDDIFSRGVLMDLTALRTLMDMGRADLAGVSLAGTIRRRTADFTFGAEHLTDPRFYGGKNRYIFEYATSDTPIIGLLKPAAGARVISRIMEMSGRQVCPGAIVFENRLGGRVCVFPYEFAGTNFDMYVKGTTQFFYTAHRKEQIRAIVRWLARGQVPLLADAPGWILPHRADGPGLVGLMVMNINHDPWQNGVRLQACVTPPVKNVFRIDNAGQWKKLAKECWTQRGNMFQARVSHRVGPLEFACLRLETG